MTERLRKYKEIIDAYRGVPLGPDSHGMKAHLMSVADRLIRYAEELEKRTGEEQ